MRIKFGVLVVAGALVGACAAEPAETFDDAAFSQSADELGISSFNLCDTVEGWPVLAGQDKDINWGEMGREIADQIPEQILIHGAAWATEEGNVQGVEILTHFATGQMTVMSYSGRPDFFPLEVGSEPRPYIGLLRGLGAENLTDLSGQMRFSEGCAGLGDCFDTEYFSTPLGSGTEAVGMGLTMLGQLINDRTEIDGTKLIEAGEFIANSSIAYARFQTGTDHDADCGIDHAIVAPGGFWGGIVTWDTPAGSTTMAPALEQVMAIVKDQGAPAVSCDPVWEINAQATDALYHAIQDGDDAYNLHGYGGNVWTPVVHDIGGTHYAALIQFKPTSGFLSAGRRALQFGFASCEVMGCDLANYFDFSSGDIGTAIRNFKNAIKQNGPAYGLMAYALIGGSLRDSGKNLSDVCPNWFVANPAPAASAAP